MQHAISSTYILDTLNCVMFINLTTSWKLRLFWY